MTDPYQTLGKIELEFVGEERPRLYRVHFNYPGHETPLPQVVSPGRGKRDGEGSCAWDLGTISMSVFLIRYRIWWESLNAKEKIKEQLFFELPVDGDLRLSSFWFAINKPTWLDAIFGSTLNGERLCNRVFCARLARGKHSIEVSHWTLQPGGVIVSWDCNGTQNDDLRRLLELVGSQWVEHGKRRSSKATPYPLLILAAAEGIFGSEAPDYRTTRTSLNELNQAGKAARVRRGTDDLYPVPELGIIDALMAGKKHLDEIEDHTGLKAQSLSRFGAGLRPLVEFGGETANLKIFRWQCALFDWTDTLVDEYQLDESICKFIPAGGSTEEAAHWTVAFLSLLHDLEAEKSPLWYDYLHLGKRFGRTPVELKREHFRNKAKISALFDIGPFLKDLHGIGVSLALVTDCHSQVLEWRAEMLGISLSSFDMVLTSDKVRDVRDKRQHLEEAIKRLNLEPPSCAVIGNDLRKDLAPAKALGFKTVWVLAGPASCAQPTPSPVAAYRGASGLVGPRRRSNFGTPGIPADSAVFDTERVIITGRTADYCLPRADLFLRICDRKRKSKK